jgi:hypothetical protein
VELFRTSLITNPFDKDVAEGVKPVTPLVAVAVKSKVTDPE